MDIEYISRRKAEAAFAVLKKPVITDDVGVYFEAWNGFPGPFAKFLLLDLGNKKVLDIFKHEANRNVIIKSAISYHDGNKIHVFIGEIKATLATKARGTDGWGFDPIIIPNGETQTFAEMGAVKKNLLSHRRLALNKLKKYLDSQKS
jgi:XTP/dITP diphosphohydrolase